MNKPYLGEQEKNRAKSIMYSIKDRMAAVESELIFRDRPYKSYLSEKLDSIYTDIKCLMSICEEGDGDENS